MFNIQTATIAIMLSLIGLLVFHISSTTQASIATAASIFWILNAVGLVLNVIATPFAPVQSLSAGLNWINLQILASYCEINGVAF